MRRISDIVITPDDRPGVIQSEPAEAPRRKAAPPPRKPVRTPDVLIRQLTPVQKTALGGLGLVAIIIGTAVLFNSGAPRRVADGIVDAVLGLTAEAGFRIEEITVTGRGRTTSEDILSALRVRTGDPILGLDLRGAKARLEALPTVRAAAVERRLPQAVHVVIAERQPVALWQSEGRFVLIDRQGHSIPGSLEGFEDLPLVVGQGAPVAAAELMEILRTEPQLARRVKSAVRVADRRWDLRLDDAAHGLEAKLPEDDPAGAWHRLAELEANRGLSIRHVTMVDLRFTDKLVVKTEHETATTDRHKDNGA